MGSESNRFTAADLPAPTPLSELAGKKFKIVNIYNGTFFLFDIMPTDTEQDEYLWLKDELNESEPAPRKLKPKVNDIVLARSSQRPPDDLPQYHRCQVREIIKTKDQSKVAVVFFLELGGMFETVPVSQLRPITPAMMQWPRLAYTVMLEDTFQARNFILSAVYKREMKKKMKETEFSVEVISAPEDPKSIPGLHKARLTYEKDRVRHDLRDFIGKMGVWEWEKYSKAQGTDNEICQNGQFGMKERTVKGVGRIPVPYPLEVGKQYYATVSRVLPDETEKDLAVLHLMMLDDVTYINYLNVLHHQMDRYAKHIAPSPYFPAINETLIMKLKNTEGVKPFVLKATQMWLRGMRMDQDVIYLFDVDEYVPFTKLERGKDYEIRRPYAEFFAIPNLVIPVRLIYSDDGNRMSHKRAEKLFPAGSRHYFTVLTKPAEAITHIPCQAKAHILMEKVYENIDVYLRTVDGEGDAQKLEVM